MVFMLASLSLMAKPATNELNGQQVKQLDQYFSALAQAHKFSGSVGIYQNNQPKYRYVVNVEDNKLSPTDKTLIYRVGSITKTFTGVMVMQLIEEKSLTLDTALSRYFPKIKNAQQITIEQMLHHTSGIASYTDDDRMVSMYDRPQSRDTILEMIYGYDSQFAPGTTSKYSNSNYFLLGLIIEHVTGNSYQENLSRRITEKLGLKHTRVGGKINTADGEVPSYTWRQNTWHLAKESDMSVPQGAGAIVSTIDDLGTFAYGLFNGLLVSESSLDLMLDIQHSFGKAIYKNEFNGIGFYGHNGAIDQFQSGLFFDKTSQTALVLLANSLSYSAQSMLESIHAVNLAEPIIIPDFSTVEVSEALLSQYSGLYKSETHPLAVELFVEEGQFFGQATGQGAFPLSAKTSEHFVFDQAGIEIEIRGKAQEFVLKQGGREDVFSRQQVVVNEVAVSEVALKAYEGTYKSPTFPLDLEIFVEKGQLLGQATGQGAFPLTPKTATEFRFSQAGIVITFNTERHQLTLSQGGKDILMTKS